MEERLLSLLRLAIKYGATDIHFDCKYGQVVIDMRINSQFRRIKSKIGDDKLIRYLQYLANLDTGRLLEPQTGQFEMEVDKKLLNLRFAAINSINYTNGVLRILSNNNELKLNEIDSLVKDELVNVLNSGKNGLILLTGPVESGKTTTVYTLLNILKNKNIFTIEDPIEVYNDNFVQLQINRDINFDYNEALKQIVRHEPDIIMVGEIRDAETIAAIINTLNKNKGIIVISTMHATNIKHAINQLQNYGISIKDLEKNILYITNQILVKDKENKTLTFIGKADSKTVKEIMKD